MRRFGRLFRPDPRDAKYTLPARASARRSRYWSSSWLGDQKETPHCVGFAWAHWLSCVPNAAYLDGHGIYNLCLFYDEWEGEEDEGTSVRAGAIVAKNVGLLSEYRWAKSKDALISTVLDLGPVVAGTMWYSRMSEPDRSNIINVGGAAVGGHAYLVDGLNLDTGLARIKCAWYDGTRPWGSAGRVQLSIDDLWRLIKADGEACLGVKRDVRTVP